MTGVIRTKIVPPQRRVGLLHRSRLVDFIHDHVNRKLLVISAAPGYGKTSLLVDFVKDTELTCCWYGMDPSDRDPWNFLAHIASTVTKAFPQLESGSLPDLVESAAHGLAPQDLLQVLVNEIHENIPEYFVILIDDFQFVDGVDEILELVNWFLDHQPDNCCLILASRTMPDLPYLQLTAQQEIAGLGSQDLAFTAEEIQAYLKLNHKMQIPLEEARELAVESEGWITGILLGTHTLWKGLIQSISSAKGKDEQIFEYMAQEVFKQQPEGTQRFLKATSILDIMHPGFCNQLLKIDNSKDLLDELENANLFVVRLSGDETAYRYHALFQGFLLKQFEPDGLEEKRSLHRGAGQLLEAEGRLEEALEHYLAGEVDQDAIRVLHQVMEPIYRAGRLVTLIRWLESLEPATLAEDPLLLVMRGRLYRQEGDFDRALELYSQARELYSQSGDQAGELKVRIHEAFVHRYQGEVQTAKTMVEDVLSYADNVPVDPASRAQAHRILGEYHHLMGELAEAKRAFRRSLKLYEEADNPYHAASMYSALGTTARRMGNPLEAEGHYAKALDILKKLGNKWRIAETQNNIGVGYFYQGEYEKARETLLQALGKAREVNHTRTEALILASLGDLYTDLRDIREAQSAYQSSLEGARLCGDRFLEVYDLTALMNLCRVDQAWEQAETLLAEVDELVGDGSGYMRGIVEMARGMILHDQGSLEEAGNALDSAKELFEEAGAKRELTRARLWSANALYQLGDHREAFEQLVHAMTLAGEIKHPHLLIVDGRNMLDLLEGAKSEGGIEGVEQLLTRIHQFTLASVNDHARVISPEVKPPRLEIHTFGEGTVKIDGKVVPRTAWGGPLVKELFFYLLAFEPLRREVILDVFWPEHSKAKAQSVFHATLYRMRRILPKGLIGYDGDNETYYVDQDLDHWYDAQVFEALFHRAQGDGEQMEELLQQVVGIYQGEFLPEIYSDWCLERRSHFHQLHLDALLMLAELKTKKTKLQEAISLYRRLIRLEPYREEFHRGLMQVLSESGRPTEAIQQYESLKNSLQAEMQVQPTQETIDLYETIKTTNSLSS